MTYHGDVGEPCLVNREIQSAAREVAQTRWGSEYGVGLRGLLRWEVARQRGAQLKKGQCESQHEKHCDIPWRRGEEAAVGR
jgi:hypothetical protein